MAVVGTSIWHKRTIGGTTRDRGLAYLMVAPAVILLALVFAVPIVSGILLSFQNVSFSGRGQSEGFGFANYQAMLQDPNFWGSLKRTAYYTAGLVAGSFAAGWAMTLLLNRRFVGRSFARLVAILPWGVPTVAAVLVWSMLYRGDSGIINTLLNTLPWVDIHVNWLINPTTALPATIVTNVWTEFAIVLLIILGGLQTIQPDLYDAAKVDGATAFQAFRYITWPLMRYTNLTLVMLLVIWSFRQFTAIYVLTGGGPGRATETLVVLTYREAFEHYRLSYGAALGVASLIITLAFTIIYVLLTGLHKVSKDE